MCIRDRARPHLFRKTNNKASFPFACVRAYHTGVRSSRKKIQIEIIRKLARNPTCHKYIKGLAGRPELQGRTGLDVSTSFLQHNQGVSYNKLHSVVDWVGTCTELYHGYTPGYTRTINSLLLCMYILFTRASSCKSYHTRTCCRSLPPVHDDFPCTSKK